MDDFVAALLCLPFLLAPAVTLIVIVVSRFQACDSAHRRN